MKTIAIIRAAGIIPAMAVNVALLIGSGGFVTRPGAIVRNGLLWPIMLPVVIGMFIAESER